MKTTEGLEYKVRPLLVEGPFVVVEQASGEGVGKDVLAPGKMSCPDCNVETLAEVKEVPSFPA